MKYFKLLSLFIFIFFFLPFPVFAQETLSYIHSDHLGSTAMVTDSEGNIISRQNYYPYGETRAREPENQSAVERQYTGQVSDQDATGLYYYNARYYSPQIALFTQADVSEGINRYAYVSGNPIKFVDPSGHEKICIPYTTICYDAASGELSVEVGGQKMSVDLTEEAIDQSKTSGGQVGNGDPETEALNCHIESINRVIAYTNQPDVRARMNQTLRMKGIEYYRYAGADDTQTEYFYIYGQRVSNPLFQSRSGDSSVYPVELEWRETLFPSPESESFQGLAGLAGVEEVAFSNGYAMAMPKNGVVMSDPSLPGKWYNQEEAAAAFTDYLTINGQPLPRYAQSNEKILNNIFVKAGIGAAGFQSDFGPGVRSQCHGNWRCMVYYNVLWNMQAQGIEGVRLKQEAY